MMGKMASRKPLNPLIPLSELKKVLAEIVNAPAETVGRAKAKTAKRDKPKP
jgi:hypothetical protein